MKDNGTSCSQFGKSRIIDSHWLVYYFNVRHVMIKYLGKYTLALLASLALAACSPSPTTKNDTITLGELHISVETISYPSDFSSDAQTKRNFSYNNHLIGSDLEIHPAEIHHKTFPGGESINTRTFACISTNKGCFAFSMATIEFYKFMQKHSDDELSISHFQSKIGNHPNWKIANVGIGGDGTPYAIVALGSPGNTLTLSPANNTDLWKTL